VKALSRARTFGSDQGLRDRAQCTRTKARAAVSTCDEWRGQQLLPGAGLAGDQDRGIGRATSQSGTGTFAPLRTTDDLLEQGGPVDFLAQRQVLFLSALLRLLAIVDVGAVAYQRITRPCSSRKGCSG